jgi:hypothetical protein
MAQLPPPRVVPWASWAEFVTVSSIVEDFTSAVTSGGDVVGPARALVRRIDVWRSRLSLPLAVDATGQLAEHFLQEQHVRVMSWCAGSLILDPDGCSVAGIGASHPITSLHVARPSRERCFRRVSERQCS